MDFQAPESGSAGLRERHSWEKRSGTEWKTFLILPAYQFVEMVSGNNHQPGEHPDLYGAWLFSKFKNGPQPMNERWWLREDNLNANAQVMQSWDRMSMVPGIGGRQELKKWFFHEWRAVGYLHDNLRVHDSKSASYFTDTLYQVGVYYREVQPIIKLQYLPFLNFDVVKGTGIHASVGPSIHFIPIRGMDSEGHLTKSWHDPVSNFTRVEHHRYRDKVQGGPVIGADLHIELGMHTTIAGRRLDMGWVNSYYLTDLPNRRALPYFAKGFSLSYTLNR